MKKKPSNESEGAVARFTVHLFGKDLDRLSELRAYLVKLGVDEANRSLLVKIALRGLTLTPELRTHLEDIRAEDGRRTRHTKARRKSR